MMLHGSDVITSVTSYRYSDSGAKLKGKIAFKLCFVLKLQCFANMLTSLLSGIGGAKKMGDLLPSNGDWHL